MNFELCFRSIQLRFNESTNPQFAIRNSKCLGGFRDFAGFYAACADLHSARASLRKLDANRLQVWIEPARGSVVSVGNVIPELRPFAANFATFCHCTYATSKAFGSTKYHERAYTVSYLAGW